MGQRQRTQVHDVLVLRYGREGREDFEGQSNKVTGWVKTANRSCMYEVVGTDLQSLTMELGC